MPLNNTREINVERSKVLKQVAIQIVSLLPNDQHEAEQALAYARTLVVDFLNHEGPEPHSSAEDNILPFKN